MHAVCLLVLCLHVGASNLFHHNSRSGKAHAHSETQMSDAGASSPLAFALKKARASRSSYGGLAQNYTTFVKAGSRGPKLDLDGIMARRGIFPPQYFASSIHHPALTTGKATASPVLVALVASSEVPWPARVEVLLNSLVTLEGALGGASSSGESNMNGGGFDLVVVVDSHGEPRPKNGCRDSKVSRRSNLLS